MSRHFVIFYFLFLASFAQAATWYARPGSQVAVNGTGQSEGSPWDGLHNIVGASIENDPDETRTLDLGSGTYVYITDFNAGSNKSTFSGESDRPITITGTSNEARATIIAARKLQSSTAVNQGNGTFLFSGITSQYIFSWIGDPSPSTGRLLRNATSAANCVATDRSAYFDNAADTLLVNPPGDVIDNVYYNWLATTWDNNGKSHLKYQYINFYGASIANFEFFKNNFKINNVGGYPIGTQQVQISGGTGTINDGTVLRIKGDGQNLTIVAHLNTGSNTTNITFTPPLATAVTNSAAITFVTQYNSVGIEMDHCDLQFGQLGAIVARANDTQDTTFTHCTWKNVGSGQYPGDNQNTRWYTAHCYATSGDQIDDIYGILHGDGQAFGGQSHDQGIWEFNEVENWHDDAFFHYQQGGIKLARNGILRYNKFHDCTQPGGLNRGIAISGANEAGSAASQSGWRIYSNEIWNMSGDITLDTSAGAGAAIRFKNADDLEIERNSFYNCNYYLFGQRDTTDGGAIQGMFVGNLCYGEPGQHHIKLLVNAGALLQLVSDYNCFFPDGTFQTGTSTTHADLAAWKLVSGTPGNLDANSISEDPLLNDATPDSFEDFQFQGGSPLLGAGTTTGVPLDFFQTEIPQGAAEDIGAVEDPPPTPTPTPTATPVGTPTQSPKRPKSYPGGRS